MVVLIGMTFFGMALEQYERNQCRIAAITIGMSASDIAEVCK